MKGVRSTRNLFLSSSSRNLQTLRRVQDHKHYNTVNARGSLNEWLRSRNIDQPVMSLSLLVTIDQPCKEFETSPRSQALQYGGWPRTATIGSDVVQSGRPIFDDFFQHLWPYIGNNTTNVVFQMLKRLWLIRIDQ
ncbi:hypothetical protein TNCV_2421101 [Trichonephila clavipes]|uniref:Uncharacterized protein n=1 Tax=Trichonephila clavipes TaxID=2585209 RepID=A0A8X6REA8_TRICX|nr:hypothetical protein TNCV_2421101 [Trichonephila clavipes]